MYDNRNKCQYYNHHGNSGGFIVVRIKIDVVIVQVAVQIRVEIDRIIMVVQIQQIMEIQYAPFVINLDIEQSSVIRKIERRFSQ